jgi:hypothetical protein
LNAPRIGFERHLAAMAELPVGTLALYRELTRRAVPVAEANGTLAPDKAARLRALRDDDAG